MNNWYQIKNQSTDNAEVLIYDIIGTFGVTSQDFIRELSAISASNITVRINSGGGDVFDAFAIYNAMKNSRKNISVQIDGLAASSASLIAMAGNTINIADNAFLMIHNPWMLAMGDHEELSKASEILAKIRDQIANIYADKTGTGAEEIKRWMDDETWMNSQEAKDARFVDNIGASTGAQACNVDKKIFDRMPEPLRAAAQVRPVDMVDLRYRFRNEVKAEQNPQNKRSENVMPEMEDKIKSVESRLNDLEKINAGLNDKLVKAEKQCEEFKAQLAAAEFREVLNKALAESELPEAAKDRVTERLVTNGTPAPENAQSEISKAIKSESDYIASLGATTKKVKDFGPRHQNIEPQDLKAKAEAYAAANNCTYRDALMRVSA